MQNAVGDVGKINLGTTFSNDRLVDLHLRLNSHEFEQVIQPNLSRKRIGHALHYLDKHYPKWEEEGFMAAWEYVLPALHHLYPDARRQGYQAEFHPVADPMNRFMFAVWIGLGLISSLIGAGSVLYVATFVLKRI